MEKYNYKRAITDEVKDWIMNDSDIPEEGIIKDQDDELYNWIYDEVWTEDAITGNGVYYYDTEEKCSEYLSGNFDLLYEAAHEFNMDNDGLAVIKHYENKSLARYFDCTIRCHLLMECIYAAVEELIKEGKIKYLTNN